jgi:hypothetical protein
MSGEFQTVSGPIGAIWQVKENIAFDFAVRGARVNDNTVGEIRAGITLAFGVATGPGLLEGLVTAIRPGRK